MNINPIFPRDAKFQSETLTPYTGKIAVKGNLVNGDSAKKGGKCICTLSHNLNM